MTTVSKLVLLPGPHSPSRPTRHSLAYSIYSLLLDLDELEALDRRLKLFSVDRFNPCSFHCKDRGDRSGFNLKGQVAASFVASSDSEAPISYRTRVIRPCFNSMASFKWGRGLHERVIRFLFPTY